MAEQTQGQIQDVGSGTIVLAVDDLAFLASRALIEIIIGVSASLVLAWSFRSASLVTNAFAIPAALVLLYLARFALARKVASATPKQLRTIALTLSAGLVLTALLWGAGATWLVATAQSGSLLYMTGGLALLISLATIITYSGLALSGYAFIGLTLAPVAVACLMSGSSDGFACALTIIAGGFVAFFLVQQFATMRLTQLSIEQMKQDLEQTLDFRESEIEKLSTSIRAHEKKERELEGELRKTSADLGLVQNKTRLLSDTIQRISVEDSATGLSNALHFANCLKMEWSRMRRAQQPLTLMRIQLDDFANYASNYDSKMLDRCLSNIADVLKDNGRRPGDCASRIGGHDFALLLPGADSASAVRIAERVRMQLIELRYPNRDSDLEILTASIGVATIVPDDETPIPELQRRCDSALHEAEFKGGNVVMRYRSLETIGLDAWKPDEDGALNQQTMSAKMRRNGFKPIKKTQPGARYLVDKRIPIGYAFGVLKGRLKVSREGQTAVLGPGDCWIVKAGTVISVASSGDQETICIEGAIEADANSA